MTCNILLGVICFHLLTDVVCIRASTSHGKFFRVVRTARFGQKRYLSVSLVREGTRGRRQIRIFMRVLGERGVKRSEALP